MPPHDPSGTYEFTPGEPSGDVLRVALRPNRRLVATARGGAMSGWLDACTFLDGDENSIDTGTRTPAIRA